MSILGLIFIALIVLLTAIMYISIIQYRNFVYGKAVTFITKANASVYYYESGFIMFHFRDGTYESYSGSLGLSVIKYLKKNGFEKRIHLKSEVSKVLD